MKHYTNTRIFHVEGIQFDWSFIFNMSPKTEKQLKSNKMLCLRSISHCYKSEKEWLRKSPYLLDRLQR